MSETSRHCFQTGQVLLRYSVETCITVSWSRMLADAKRTDVHTLGTACTTVFSPSNSPIQVQPTLLQPSIDSTQFIMVFARSVTRLARPASSLLSSRNALPVQRGAFGGVRTLTATSRLQVVPNPSGPRSSLTVFAFSPRYSLYCTM